MIPSSLRHAVLALSIPALALLATPARAQDASPSSEGPGFGKWETRVLAGPGKDVVRAAAWSMSGKTLLSYDFYVDDCRGVSFGMAWVRAQPADHDLYLKDVATTLQVDDHPAIPFLSTYQLARGEAAAQLTLAAIDDFTAAIGQMEQGRKVRMRVPWDADTRANDILEDYPLDGFAAALDWARKTCRDIADHRPGTGQPLP